MCISIIFFFAILLYLMSIGFAVSYRLGAWKIITAVPTMQAIVKSQRKIRSNTIATYFQSSSTCNPKINKSLFYFYVQQHAIKLYIILYNYVTNMFISLISSTLLYFLNFNQLFNQNKQGFQNGDSRLFSQSSTSCNSLSNQLIVTTEVVQRIFLANDPSYRKSSYPI